MTLQGKVVLVIGGSRGIGGATARLLASQGASVVVTYLQNVAKAEQLVEDIQTCGGQVYAVQTDIRDLPQTERLIEQILSKHEHIDALINSASLSAVIKPFAAMNWDEFGLGVNSELKAAFNSTKAVVPIMQQQHYGRIVYVGSGLSQVPTMYGGISIGAAKGALVSFAKYIAKEYGPDGITANVVAPGIVKTELSAAVPVEQRQSLAAMTPLGRIAQPEDIARVIAFFASDESGFMTGTYAPVNGGLAM